MTKTEQKLRADPRVDEISDERAFGSGIWIYLKGHCNGDNPHAHSQQNCVHAVHEDTWTACLRGMRSVVPCDCSGCRIPDRNDPHAGNPPVNFPEVRR